MFSLVLNGLLFALWKIIKHAVVRPYQVISEKGDWTVEMEGTSAKTRSPVSKVNGKSRWIEQIPLFFIIPLVLMLVLFQTKLKRQWFMAYSLSITIAYLANYLWMYMNNTHDKVLFSADSIDLIFLILPSLFFAIVMNWMVFRKTYRKLERKT